MKESGVVVVELAIDRIMVEPILEVCPTFQPIWDDFLREWQMEKDALPYYLALAALTKHLVSMLDRGDTKYFPEIFKIVERWHGSDVHYVKKAATIGLLEDIQNFCRDGTNAGREKEAKFEEWFGPETLKSWNALRVFWNGE